ncbi:hypothetical protein [Brytella acorum]|uniref:hypothetical protein n=1 Tax=Brytella acorum TaxID=2959299 RepID=UPI0038D0DB8E
MTGIAPTHLKLFVVRPSLKALGLWSEAAENLLVGTALAESRAAYLRQVTSAGYGPALGLWQMDPFTHNDCWLNFLNGSKQATLRRVVSLMISMNLPGVDQLATNLRYACAMARIKFYRAPAALPAASDAAALSQYHKRFYNTATGAADTTANATFFQEAINACLICVFNGDTAMNLAGISGGGSSNWPTGRVGSRNTGALTVPSNISSPTMPTRG